jgi:hypothetical protein
MEAVAHEVHKNALIVVDICPSCGSVHTKTDMQCWSVAVISCLSCDHRWVMDRKRG